MKSEIKLLTGSCLCRAVQYTVADEFQYALYCHCSDCRRATGAAFKPFAGIDRTRLRITSGEEQIHIYGNPAANHDVHCRLCGSLLYSIVNEGAVAHITLGTLLDTPSIRPTAHIFVSDKAPWHQITDGLPQHDQYA